MRRDENKNSETGSYFVFRKTLLKIYWSVGVFEEIA